MIGKFICPEYTEFVEIDWKSLKSHLKEISISTKFPTTDNLSGLSASPQSNCSNSSSSPVSPSPLDLYSKTLFNYLHDNNQLEYIALKDFTLKFPNETSSAMTSSDLRQQQPKRLRRSLHNNNLKYLYLRNIRNVRITTIQADNLKSFLEMQCNLLTLDLIGIQLSSDFICSILYNLNNLR